LVEKPLLACLPIPSANSLADSAIAIAHNFPPMNTESACSPSCTASASLIRFPHVIGAAIPVISSESAAVNSARANQSVSQKPNGT
jgi:hypothetical protein